MCTISLYAMFRFDVFSVVASFTKNIDLFTHKKVWWLKRAYHRLVELCAAVPVSVDVFAAHSDLEVGLLRNAAYTPPL